MDVTLARATSSLVLSCLKSNVQGLKSSLFSRITEPTSGRAIIRGRVASLPEVGTGFHPEFTERENIFLNGTILGGAAVTP